MFKGGKLHFKASSDSSWHLLHDGLGVFQDSCVCSDHRSTRYRVPRVFCSDFEGGVLIYDNGSPTQGHTQMSTLASEAQHIPLPHSWCSSASPRAMPFPIKEGGSQDVRRSEFLLRWHFLMTLKLKQPQCLWLPLQKPSFCLAEFVNKTAHF